MSAPLFTGIPAIPPPWVRHEDLGDEQTWHRAALFAADGGGGPGGLPSAPAALFAADGGGEPGVLPPVLPGSTTPNEPPETVIQPPGAIVVRPRLAVPPAREPLDFHTLRAESEQLQSTSVAPLMAVSGDMFASGSPFQAPGVFIPNISVRNTQVGVIPRPYGIIGDVIVFDPSLQRDFTGLAYLSAGSIGLFGVTEHGTSAMALMGFFSNNFASLGFTHYNLSGSILTTYNAFLVGWRDYLGISGQFVYANSANNTVLIGGGLYAKTMQRGVIDLGTYRGRSADALAQAHGHAVGTPLRRVEVRRRTGNTLQLRAGGGTTMIAAMLRVDRNTNRDIAYRTFMPITHARDLVFEGKGPALFFKNKLRALGWLRDPLAFPDHKIPESIPLGDEIQVVRSATYTVGLLVGQLAGWASGQLWFRGDVELSIRRVSEHKMEVTVTPIKLRAASLYAMDPFGPHAATRATRAVVSRQTLTFDLRQPQARRAYLETVNGKGPLPLPKKHTLTRTPMTPNQIGHAVQQRAMILPRGVERTVVHTLRGSLTDFGAGIKWLFVPTELLPKGFVLGLTTHRQRMREMQTVTDGNTQHSADTFAHLAVTERLAGGRKAVYTQAQAFTHGQVDGPQRFDTLKLSSTFNDTRLFRNNYNRRMVGALNTLFNGLVDDAKGKHVREERQLQITRHLDAGALATLGNWLAPYAGHGAAAPSARLVNIARTTRVNSRKIRKLLQTVGAQSGPAQQALAVQKFVRSHHIKGFAAVQHLLDSDYKKLSVSTTSSAYDAPIAKTEALCLKYVEPIDASTSPREVVQRYKDVEKNLQALQKGRAEVKDDPLIATARDYYLLVLSNSETRLYNLLNLPPERAPAVQRYIRRQRVHRTWHKRIIQAITPLDSLLAPVHALQAAWQGRPPPMEPKTFIARFQALYNAAMRVRAHLHYLKRDAALLPAGERAVRTAALNQARQTLVGEAHFNRGRLGGLLDVGALSPSARAVVRWALPHRMRDPASKALRKQLDCLAASA